MHNTETQKAMLLFEVFTIYRVLTDVRFIGSGMQHTSPGRKSNFCCCCFLEGKKEECKQLSLKICSTRTTTFLHCGCTAIQNTAAKQLKKCKKQLIENVLVWAVSICFTIYHVTVNLWSSTTTTGALQSGHSYTTKSE